MAKLSHAGDLRVLTLSREEAVQLVCELVEQLGTSRGDSTAIIVNEVDLRYRLCFLTEHEKKG